MKVFIIIFQLLLISFEVCLGEDNLYFSVSDLNIRESSSLNSKSIGGIPKGTVVKIIGKSSTKERIGFFNSYWYKTEWRTFSGWLYGGYLIKYNGQDINEFLKRYEFIKYFHYGKAWYWSDKKNKSYEIYLGYSGYGEYLANDSLELEIKIDVNNNVIFYEKYVIDKFEKNDFGYILYVKNISKNGSESSIPEQFAVISMDKDQFVFRQIREIKSKKNMLEFNTEALIDVKFNKAFEINGYGGYVFSRIN
ncbi:MAG TPA: SH3 domain-containing protein [Spirochaetota bacterium]|nr:SH3 domain-containing protein [Spirochaetota bacterium]